MVLTMGRVLICNELRAHAIFLGQLNNRRWDWAFPKLKSGYSVKPPKGKATDYSIEVYDIHSSAKAFSVDLATGSINPLSISGYGRGIARIDVPPFKQIIAIVIGTYFTP